MTMTMQEVNKKGINLVSPYTTFVRAGKTYTEYFTDNYWLCEYRFGNYCFTYKLVANSENVARVKGFEKVKKALVQFGIEDARVWCWSEPIRIVAVV